jgi:hypothetical protein
MAEFSVRGRVIGWEVHVRKRRRQDLDVDRLTELVQGDRACRDLRRYYGVGLGKDDLPPFTGGRFEFLDSGGDQPDVCNQFTASDLVAAQLLSVRVPARVALDLLEAALGEEVAESLRLIPTSVPLWADDAEQLIRTGGPADTIWELLEHQDGVGWVTAGKLLARKRPSLIPVYDEVVRCAFGWPEDIWQALRAALRQEGGRFRADVEGMMRRAGVPSAVTVLRGLDVAIWMNHRSTHTGYRCSGLT